MPELITIEDLLEHVSRAELDQVAGIGSHNAPEGRSLDEVKINAAIKYAGDLVKGYLQRRYPLVKELTPEQTPDLIKGYTADIVRHRLRDRTGNRNTTTDEVDKRFDDARAWLREVSRGLVNVDLSDAPGGEDAAEAAAVNPGGKVHVAYEPARASSILDGY